MPLHEQIVLSYHYPSELILITLDLPPMEKCIGAILCILFICACSDVQERSNAIRKSNSLNPEKRATVPPTKEVRTKKKNRIGNYALRKGSADLLEAPVSDIEKFYASVAKKNQTFTIQSQNDTTIYCEEGTSIFIPAYAFRNIHGDIITGPVTFSVTEYISREDIVLNRLSTMSGDMLLETGGMLYLAASFNGQDLQLIPGKSLNIEVPVADEIKNDMQIFSGIKEQDQINWVLADNSIKIKTTKVTTQSIGNEYSVLSCRITDKAIEKYKWSGTYYRLRDSLQTDTIVYELKIDKKGRLKNVKFISGTGFFKKSTLRGSEKRYTNTREPEDYFQFHISAIEQQNGFRLMPGKKRIPKVCIHQYQSRVNSYLLREKLKRKERKNLTVLLVEEIITKATNTFFQRPGAASYEADIATKKLQNLENARLGENDVHEIGYYSLAVMKLGHINIDRFYSDPRPKFVMTIPATHRNTNYQLVFKKDQVYLSPYKSDREVVFKNIPEGEEVVLVVTRIENNKLQLSTRNFIVGNSMDVEDLQFKHLNVAQVKEELRKSLE